MAFGYQILGKRKSREAEFPPTEEYLGLDKVQKSAISM